MISLHLARSLKQAGLIWQAGVNDFFAIPDRGMDDRVFVIADLLANLDIFRGWPVVTFHGSAEWALDYILTTEVVWLPSEEQLRHALLNVLPGDLTLLEFIFDGQSYHCSIALERETVQFAAPTGAGAYGQALLHFLERRIRP